MDTSIIVVIAIAVVFVVVVPALIRRSATELSRADLDRVPDDARVIRAESHNPCRDQSERVTVFHAEVSEPAVPRVALAPAAPTPALRLSAQAPDFAVIDGEGAPLAEASPTAPQEAESQLRSLPVAVGETGSAFVSTHDSTVAEAAGADNVRLLHPAVHAVFNQTGASPTNSGSGGSVGGRSGGSARHTAAPTSGTAAGRDTAATRGTAPARGRVGHLGEAAQHPTHPATRTDEDHAMTERAAPLRESLRTIGTMVRGFALVFLASVLGIVVTGVLALLSVVHPALIGVFVGLAVVSLFIVRTLNLRKRDIRRRLRRLSTPPAEAVAEESAEPEAEVKTARAATSTAAARSTGAARTAQATRTAQAARPNRTAAPRTAARDQATTAQAEAAPKSAPARSAATTGSARAGSGKSTGSARARAVMQRSATAKYAREEAVTGEIPIVRIRKEAAEGHSTRQILLTGPIPVVDEAAISEAERTDESTRDAKTADSPAGKAQSATTEVASADDSATTTTPTTSTPGVADDLLDAAPTTVPSTATEAHRESTAVSDPFQQRLQARDGWSPTPVPVPSYVDAAEAEHAAPTSAAADASSYSTEARSREDIAAEFAAELGYRAELSDSAREESPLEHGRKAIRADKAPALDAVNDVLARRRA